MAFDFFILAFGFGNLAMLGWLAAAGAPLLIHLWSRRRYRQVPWAAMHFLLAAMQKNSRRLQLQQWLLLAIRTLIILLVVFAVAQPYGEGLLAGGRSVPTHRVLVIDSSFSMSYREADESLFTRAQRIATELIRESSPDDVFTIIQMAQPPKIVLGGEAIDRSTIISEIDSLSQTQGGADLMATCALAADAILSAKAGDRPIERHEVVFLTDLQRATWHAIASSAASDLAGKTAAIRESQPNDPIARLVDRANVVVVDLGASERSNLAATQLSVQNPFATAGSEIVFEGTLHEFGDQPRDRCAVELLVDNEPVGERIVDVPSGGDARVRFTHQFRSVGAHTIAMRAADDQLAIDNTRWLTLDVADNVRVLCVEGKPGAAKFVANALDPDPTDSSPIRPLVASEGELAELEFAPFACVFLCNVSQLTSNESARLARYVEHGGGVVFFLGDQIMAEQYNALANGNGALLPARVGELISEPQFRLDPLGYRHPIVTPFRGRERAGLLTTPVARYFRLEIPVPSDESAVALALASGDPLIVTRTLGRGRTVLVATDGSLSSIDPITGEPWTMWPTWPSFLPIVRELLDYAVSERTTQQSLLVGAPISGFSNRSEGGMQLQITRPDGRTDSVSPTKSQSGWEWSYDRTDLSGVYAANADSSDSNIHSQLFAVNVDPRESDLKKVASGDLPPQFLVRQDLHADGERSNDNIAARAAWHGTLLSSAFALLLLESLLAWAFGRRVA